MIYLSNTHMGAEDPEGQGGAGSFQRATGDAGTDPEFDKRGPHNSILPSLHLPATPSSPTPLPQ